jgi:hypothetical protein
LQNARIWHVSGVQADVQATNHAPNPFDNRNIGDLPAPANENCSKPWVVRIKIQFSPLLICHGFFCARLQFAVCSLQFGIILQIDSSWSNRHIDLHSTTTIKNALLNPRQASPRPIFVRRFVYE